MPKVTFTFRKKITTAVLVDTGHEVRALVAEAFSTSTQLTSDDVDWIPEHRPEKTGALVPDFSIEIEAIGYAPRKKKLTDEVVKELKADILALDAFAKADPSKPLIWIKYIDPSGQHI